MLVDAGNGKVLASTQMSMAAMMQSGMGMMGPGMGMMGPGMGMMGPGMGMMGPGMGMMGPGMMKGPGNDDGALDILGSSAANTKESPLSFFLEWFYCYC